MTVRQPNLFTRDDTFFGVCQGLGEDFGFNPLWLRLALTLALFWNPMAAIGTYAALALAVLAARLLSPTATTASVPEQTMEAAADELEPLPLAA